MATCVPNKLDLKKKTYMLKLGILETYSVISSEKESSVQKTYYKLSNFLAG